MLTLLENEIIYGIKDITSHAKATGKPADLYNRLTLFFKKLGKEHALDQILRSTESSELSKKLLEELNAEGSKKIIKVGNTINAMGLDKPEHAEAKKIVSDTLGKYTIRHYSSSNPLDWAEKKVKSNLTLAAKNILEGKPLLEQRTTSGHTNFTDWCHIGNIGDTFYSLFFDGKPATGITPNFISNATCYIEWTLEKFEDCWASPDWLSGIYEPAFSGNCKDVIIASLLNANPKPVQRNAIIKEIVAPSRILKNYTNYEIKKHGSLTFTPDQVHSC